MKNYFFFIAASLMMGGCDHSNHNHAATENKTEANFYGAQFDPSGAISVDSIATMLNGKDSVQVKFTGVIEETCSKKGCWMDIKLANGETMMVRMKDYGFFVPTSGAADLKCTVSGWAFREVTPVEDLRHYAEDAGKSAEEIAAITEPKEGLAFMADGIMIEGYKPSDHNHEHHEGDGHDHHEGDGHDHHEGDGHSH